MTDILKHLDLNSADGTQLNLDALYQIAPSALPKYVMTRLVKSPER